MPVEREAREARRKAIVELLAARPQIGRQTDLVRELMRRGFAVTQSSVSRDLRAIGVAKVDGAYVVPDRESPAAPDPGLAPVAPFLRGVRPAGPHLTVVSTAVGAAQSVGLAVDRAGWPEVVGTVAGDDTLFVATGSGRAQRRFVQRLERVLRRARTD